jgi:MraZ protein
VLLTGAFHRSLDEKLRFAIPKPLRDAIGHPNNSVLYLAPGTEGSLALYTEDAFERLAGRLEQGSPNARDTRAFSRLFYAQVQRVEIDKQGRVRLPAELARLAAIQKEIVLVGVREHLEIWDRMRWEEYLSETQPHYDELAENAFVARTTPDSMTARQEPPAMQPSGVDTGPVRPR